MDLTIKNVNGISEKSIKDFGCKLFNLQIVEFLGIAGVLGVDPKNPDFKEDEEPSDTNNRLRDFQSVCIEVVEAYCACDRSRRRRIDTIMNKALKEKSNPLQ